VQSLWKSDASAVAAVADGAGGVVHRDWSLGYELDPPTRKSILAAAAAGRDAVGNGDGVEGSHLAAAAAPDAAMLQ
jgi:hypothetical protein